MDHHSPETMDHHSPDFVQLTRDRRPIALGDLQVLSDDLICAILEFLSCRDVSRLACTSSVLYILCNEEPLWMSLCLRNARGQLQYKGSWKKTAIFFNQVSTEHTGSCKNLLQLDGFNSLFLHRRFYRCHTRLEGFSFDNAFIERKKDLTLEDFVTKYDGQKPVILSELANNWPARNSWNVEQLLSKYGDTAFLLSQRSSKKIRMTLKDYVSYIKLQNDEDPLYIFDEKFGEVAPGLLNDYTVPHLFQEDFFEVLDVDQRPPFRWLVVGPERSGASWHVDPALTSAWNTLLIGRKRWALYPPGKVPLGVAVHVNEDDGDVHIEAPSPLQWWLDFYPHIADEDKPIECTQLPGETMYVPSGWWHCVLNLEVTIAVTQNFVNGKNFEFVCLDMAPGYQHKGVCRAGLLALESDHLEQKKNVPFFHSICPSYDESRSEKRQKVTNVCEEFNSHDMTTHQTSLDGVFCYDIKFLATFLDEERDHYNSLWSPSNCIGQREFREWLCKLWIGKPHQRDLIWKGACLAINANRWVELIEKICSFHNLPPPKDSERLPVGTGSNPVYLVGDFVIKIYAEGGIEEAFHALGTEIQFYTVISEVNSPLKNHIPDILASGILIFQNGSFGNVPWGGKEMYDLISQKGFQFEIFKEGFCFDIWSKMRLEYLKAGIPSVDPVCATISPNIWPYTVTRQCEGRMFALLRDSLPLENFLLLASFLGKQLGYLHSLSFPAINPCLCIQWSEDLAEVNDLIEALYGSNSISSEWKIFIATLSRRKKHILSRLSDWGNPVPDTLLSKLDEYLPDNFAKLLNVLKDESGKFVVGKRLSWIHSDIMDDNIYMKPSRGVPCSKATGPDRVSLASGSVDKCTTENGYSDNCDVNLKITSWNPTHILDFSDLTIGDPLCDLFPIYIDVFRGDSQLLNQFLLSYKLPLMPASSEHLSVGSTKFGRLSYHAMCYCILHEENVLGAIFSLWKELRMATSWEEVEEAVWGMLNDYKGF